MPKKWPSLRAVLEFSPGIEGFTWRAAVQPEGSGVWRALCGSRGLAVPCVIRPPLPFPAPPEPSTPALLPGAASIDIPVFLLYPHL